VALVSRDGIAAIAGKILLPPDTLAVLSSEPQ
jgi:hypothetical protein